MFFKLLDFFIAPAFYRQQELFYKARLLVGTLLSFLASALLVVPVYAAMPTGSDNTVMLVSMVLALLFSATIWGALLWLIKIGRAFLFATHATIASLSLLIVLGLALSGGPLLSKVNPMLIIPMVAAFVLLGKRGGLTWGAICVLAFLAMAGFAVQGFNFPLWLSPKNSAVVSIFGWVHSFMVIGVLVFIYEQLNQHVSQQRDEQQNKLQHLATMAIESSTITSSTELLATSSEQLLSLVMQQKTAIDQLSATSEELNASAHNNSLLAKQSLNNIDSLQEHIHAARKALDSLTDNMLHTQGLSTQVQKINNVINDIASQTNLLSLNAMIEASRADKAGGGFKVVAQEVKSLAERSANSASDINRLLFENSENAEQGVALAQTMRQRFEASAEQIEPLANAVKQVASASYQQDAAIRQVSTGLFAMTDAVDHNQELAQALADNAQQLREQSNQLEKLLQQVQQINAA